MGHYIIGGNNNIYISIRALEDLMIIIKFRNNFIF
jgi:hypothetical protein